MLEVKGQGHTFLSRCGEGVHVDAGASKSVF